MKQNKTFGVSLGVVSLIEVIVAFLCTFCVVSVILLSINKNPWEVLKNVMIGAFGSLYSITKTLTETIPIFFCAIAFTIPLLGGFFNLGAQGQLEMGAFVAVLIALNVKTVSWIGIFISLLGSIMAGALLILIALLLKIFKGVNEVVVTIMLNFVIQFCINGLVLGPFKEPGAWFGTTPKIASNYRLPIIFSNLHIGILIVFVTTIILHITLKYTFWGLKLKATGINPIAARVAGIEVKKIVLYAGVLGGALAGLAGGIQALGVVHRIAENWSKPWGWWGLAAGLLGSGNAIGILLASFLYGALETGARYMQAMTGVSAAFVYVFQGLPVLLLLVIKSSKVFSNILYKRIEI